MTDNREEILRLRDMLGWVEVLSVQNDENEDLGFHKLPAVSVFAHAIRCIILINIAELKGETYEESSDFPKAGFLLGKAVLTEKGGNDKLEKIVSDFRDMLESSAALWTDKSRGEIAEN